MKIEFILFHIFISLICVFADRFINDDVGMMEIDNYSNQLPFKINRETDTSGNHVNKKRKFSQVNDSNDRDMKPKVDGPIIKRYYLRSDGHVLNDPNNLVLEEVNDWKKDNSNNDALNYFLSLYCYEYKNETPVLKKEFAGRLFGANGDSEYVRNYMPELLGNEDFKKKQWTYPIMNSYFKDESRDEKKRCLESMDISMALKNLRHWEDKLMERGVETFRELFVAGKNLIKPDRNDSSMFYVLSKYCIEKRFNNSQVNIQELSDKIFDDDISLEGVLSKYLSEENDLSAQNSPLVRKRRCPQNITKTRATSNYNYWKRQAQNALDEKEFDDLSRIVDQILMRN